MSFKRIKVIMLPAKEGTECGLVINTYITESHGISPIQYRLDIKGYKSIIERGYLPHHLYFLSDDEIKVGDWYIEKTAIGNYIHQMTEESLKGWNSTPDKLDNFNRRCKKIIATTDKSLKLFKIGTKNNLIGRYENLPQPSQAFIKKYCEKGGIDEVMVEYEDIEKCFYEVPRECENSDCRVLNKCNKEFKTLLYKLKVSSDNTITIKSVKDSHSTEEVEILLRKFSNTTMSPFRESYRKEQTDKFIKENL
jgi:hypothetical protein